MIVHSNPNPPCSFLGAESALTIVSSSERSISISEVPSRSSPGCK